MEKRSWTRREFVRAASSGFFALGTRGLLGARHAFGERATQERPNIVIIFMDDQGYHDLGCFGSPNIETPNPDRIAAEDMKFTGMWEPCTMRWPDRIPRGAVRSEVCVAIDLLPTIARLAGASLPQDRAIDGKDTWPLMAVKAGVRSPHKAFYYYRGTKLQAVRSGQWKLCQVKETDLYHLRDDVGEQRNLASEHLEMVRRLTGKMETFDQELKASARPPGRVAVDGNR